MDKITQGIPSHAPDYITDSALDFETLKFTHTPADVSLTVRFNDQNETWEVVGRTRRQGGLTPTQQVAIAELYAEVAKLNEERFTRYVE